MDKNSILTIVSTLFGISPFIYELVYGTKFRQKIKGAKIVCIEVVCNLINQTNNSFIKHINKELNSIFSSIKDIENLEFTDLEFSEHSIFFKKNEFEILYKETKRYIILDRNFRNFKIVGLCLYILLAFVLIFIFLDWNEVPIMNDIIVRIFVGTSILLFFIGIIFCHKNKYNC